MKKKQEVQISGRCWGIIIVFLFAISFVVANGMYTKGYDSTELLYESGALIVSSSGYTVEENKFTYTGDENSYVQIANAQQSDQLLIAFGNRASDDVPITVLYTDEEGNIQENSSQGTWKKGNGYVKIDIESGQYGSYLLVIPGDFTLKKVYYAAENAYQGAGKPGIFAICFIVLLILAGILMINKKVRQIFYSIDMCIYNCYKNICGNAKQYTLYLVKFLIVMMVAVVAAYIMAKAGLYAFSGKAVVLAALLSLLISMILFFYKAFSSHIEIVGFFAVIIIGSVIAILEPPNVGVSWDDEIHFRSAVEASHIIDQKISAADSTIIGDYTWVALQKVNYGRTEQQIYSELLNELVKSNYFTQPSRQLAGKNVLIAYIPSVIGLLIGRGLHLPYYGMLVLGRWMNLLLLAILTYWSMKKLKSGKIVPLMVALIPTNIFLAANYTYDVWLTAWTMFGICVFLGEWQRKDEKIQWWTPWLIGGAMCLGVMPKLVYFPLTFIALFMPAAKFKTNKEKWLYRGVILGAALLPFAAAYMQNIAGNGMGQGDTRGGEAVNAGGQLQFIRNNPQKALLILLGFLKDYLNPLKQGAEYLTKMAYVGYTSVNSNVILVVLFVAAFISRETGETEFPWWTRAGVLVVYAGIGFMAAFSMYVAYTAVEADTVLGCQGRYLFPALFPVLYVCTRLTVPARIKNILKESNINIAVILFLAYSAIIGLWQGCLAIY